MPKPCADCGPMPVYHAAEWLSNFSDWFLAPITKPLEALRQVCLAVIRPLHFEKALPLVFRAAAALGLGAILTKPDKHVHPRTVCLWEEARRRGIAMYEFRPFRFPINTFVARYGKAVLIFDGLPRPQGQTSPSLSWMDNKALMREKFSRAGIPVARGGACFFRESGECLFQKLKKPVIVKPSVGSRARHTTRNVRTLGDFWSAFARAKRLSPWVVVEEELAGTGVFRPTIVGNRIVAVLRKDRPAVLGDGASTVRTLAEKENKRPERRGPVFHKIPLGKSAEAALQSQGLAWESVPRRGTRVFLGQKESRSLGGTTTDVTDIVHEENLALFQKINRVLQDPLVGIDFIVEDISRPWRKQQPCGVIECNSLPFIDLHHYPLFGKSRNIAGAIWDLVLPESKRKVGAPDA
jgi:D-alanine-D-alanine ligase-like ATP-grasp enzyme